jgi:hypothetical protein
MNHSSESFKTEPNVSFYEYVLNSFDTFPTKNHVVSIAPSCIVPEDHVYNALESSIGYVLDLTWEPKSLTGIIGQYVFLSTYHRYGKSKSENY